ncbi:diguanylate cyclase domain-containing protein [Kangiella shandongensis]|uniref:diguanylate cyclase domain-containing protein n=1 Tax=Kangiella shandongensis TaxID=2763258 RepID=UPI001CC0CC31|nr:diguanylate cyclase [Kangiella shandongensis]
MSLGPFFKSKRSILLWIALISAVLSIVFYQQYHYFDTHYSILPQAGKAPSYAKDTSQLLVKRQHPNGFFVNNPDLFTEPSVLNLESLRLSRYAVETLDQLGTLNHINKKALTQFVLRNYKAPSNAIGNLKGFSALPNSSVNIRATMDSVIILKHLNALEQVDSNAIAQLILAYQNDDGGFWDPGYPEFEQQSTVQATSFAIRTLLHLNKVDLLSTMQQQSINQFIQRSWSSDIRAFAPFPEHPAVSSYDSFRAWISVYYLPINQGDPQKINNILHLPELLTTLNTTFLTTEQIYSEEGESQRNSLKASYLIVWMLSELDQLEQTPAWNIIRFIKDYRDSHGGFSGDIYSVYSVVKTLKYLSPTRMSNQLLIYQVLTYTTLGLMVLSLLALFIIRGEVQRRRRSALVHKAQTDRLTGLHNREFLEKRYVSYQTNNSHIALLLLDVDYFKNINDNYGHLTGDEVLIELSHLLKDNIRKTDTLARWGGEEFAILCPATEPGQAKTFSEKMRNLVANHQFSKVNSITCSIGVSCSHQNESLKNLFARADKALYDSKHNGRNRVTYV